DQLESINSDKFKPFIKILFIPAGYQVAVDFTVFELSEPALFFVNTNQFLQIVKATNQHAQLLYYNRDFYCVQIHDAEVACDGILFNNVLQMPMVSISQQNQETIANLLCHIKEELQQQDSSSEEMVRTYLKQLIIHATRLWKKDNLVKNKKLTIHTDQELFRDFGRLVEIHFREKHSVADYADLLHYAPKTLANKFNKLHLENPNDFIKNRIVLEAKRLLIYTELTVKEIAYQLGYDDPAYFNRLFAQKAGSSPALFKKNNKE
ncbi:MAG: AraC family transcriptional regulator, partial [Pseudopedobacter saltans]